MAGWQTIDIRILTRVILAVLVALQVALGPLASSVERAAAASDPFMVICSQSGRTAAVPDLPLGHTQDISKCCQIGCLLASAGLLPPLQISGRLDRPLELTSAAPALPPGDEARVPGPSDGAPQAPRGPPQSIS